MLRFVWMVLSVGKPEALSVSSAAEFRVITKECLKRWNGSAMVDFGMAHRVSVDAGTMNRLGQEEA